MEPSVLKSFIDYSSSHHFPLENIPFGVFVHPKTTQPTCGSRIGDFIIDLGELEAQGILKTNVFKGERFLNKFMESGRDTWHAVRVSIQSAFKTDGSVANNDNIKNAVLIPVDGIKMELPVYIRDYTDFYSSKNHAYNVGVMIRGPDNALQPNWLHLPVGYHGRASSVVITGTEIRRPRGQTSLDKLTPTWTECKRLDIELEMGTYLGKSNKLGEPIKMKDAGDYVFGYCLLNDWSARDLQFWEYIPLGPFNSKNFATTVSPWVITAEALEPFKVTLEKQDPEPLNYLKSNDNFSYDIQLDVLLKTPSLNEPEIISTSNMKYLYWSIYQQLVHHSVSGCNMGVGDLLGTGTISGTDPKSYGSLLELTWQGKNPLKLSNGEERIFLQNNDTIYLQGVCKGNGFTIGFGECAGTVIPALPDDAYY